MKIAFAHFTPEEEAAVSAIITRWETVDPDVDRLSLRMDFAAVHAEIPLDLVGLAAADQFEFVHDVGGIVHHMNRETGLLDDHFLPRFAR